MKTHSYMNTSNSLYTIPKIVIIYKQLLNIPRPTCSVIETVLFCCKRKIEIKLQNICVGLLI